MRKPKVTLASLRRELAAFEVANTTLLAEQKTNRQELEDFRVAYEQMTLEKAALSRQLEEGKSGCGVLRAANETLLTEHNRVATELQSVRAANAQLIMEKAALRHQLEAERTACAAAVKANQSLDEDCLTKLDIAEARTISQKEAFETSLRVVTKTLAADRSNHGGRTPNPLFGEDPAEELGEGFISALLKARDRALASAVGD